MSIEALGATAPNIGHNSGTDAADLIERTLRRADEIERGARDYCEVENTDLMRRLKELQAMMAAGLPEKISTKAEAEKLSDARFAIKKWIAAAKQARTGAKRPWDSIAKAFYAFFTRPIDDLEAVDAERIEPVLADWQEREAARIKRDEAERERILREESDRKAKEAAEAEARRMAAERAEREAKERAEQAERDREADIRRQEEAKRERERQDLAAKEAKAKAEEYQRQAEAAARKLAEDEAAAKIAREEQRQAEEAAAEERRKGEEASQAAAKAREEEAAAKAAAAGHRDEMKAADRAAVEARKEQRAEKRTESEAMADAIRAEKQADKSQEKVDAKPADLSRVRGEAGSVSSLRTFMNFRNIDRRQIELEALRQHIPIDALATAVRSFIDAGGRSLRGVEIFEDTQATTR